MAIAVSRPFIPQMGHLEGLAKNNNNKKTKQAKKKKNPDFNNKECHGSLALSVDKMSVISWRPFKSSTPDTSALQQRQKDVPLKEIQAAARTVILPI